MKNPLINDNTGRAAAVRAAQQGNAGYDNPRENIDPNIKTQAISLKEINGNPIKFLINGELAMKLSQPDTDFWTTLEISKDGLTGEILISDGSGDMWIKNQTEDANISFFVNNGGGSVEVIEIEGATSNVNIIKDLRVYGNLNVDGIFDSGVNSSKIISGSGLYLTGSSTTILLDALNHAFLKLNRGNTSSVSVIQHQTNGSTIFEVGMDNNPSYPDYYIGDSAQVNKWLTITTAGKVGIGTISPSTKFEVSGAISGSSLFSTNDISGANLYSRNQISGAGITSSGTISGSNMLALNYTSTSAGISIYGANIIANTNGSGAGAYGIQTSATASSSSAYGGYFSATGSNSYGMYALGNGGSFVYGVYGRAINGSRNWAGYFEGDVESSTLISGTNIKGIYQSADGSTGATGSFTSADSKTISVKNGIIVSIV